MSAKSKKKKEKKSKFQILTQFVVWAMLLSTIGGLAMGVLAHF